MSVRLLTKYRKSLDDISVLSPGARFTLFCYCECADNYTLLAYPGTPLLMRMMGFGERQVQRYVQECRERGFLSVVKNRGGRRQYAVYRVNLGVPAVDTNKIPPEVRDELIRKGLLSDDATSHDSPTGTEGEETNATSEGTPE